MQRNNNGIFKSAGIIAFFALLSRIVGLYRDRLFAAHFGAGDVLDAYYSAFRVPDLVFNILILGTLSVSFIPIFTEYFIKDKEHAKKIANTVLAVAFLGISLICFILFLFAAQLTHLASPGFTGEKYQNTLMLTKIFLLSPIIFTLSTVFASMLNALKHFVLVSIAPILYNFGIIIGIVWFYPAFGIKGLAYGVILGAVIHLLIQFAGAMIAGFRLSWSFDIKDVAVKKMGKLFLWRIIGMDSSQVSLLVASIVGSTLIAGSISVFNLANNLQSVIVGMFGISFAIAAFPNLSESFAINDTKEFGRIFSRTIVHILFFVIPISVLFILLRAQIVRVILGTGEFDWQATRLTANTLGIFALSIFAQGLAPLFSRAFYAMRNTYIPVLVGLLSMFINVVLSILIGRKYGVVGLSIAFTISNIFNLLFLWLALRPRMKDFNEWAILKTATKIIAATVIMALVTYVSLQLYSTFLSLNTGIKVFAQGAIAGTLGIIAFVITAILLDLDEVKIAVSILRKKLWV